MWRLVILLVLLIASVWAGLQILHHPGYLLLVYGSWMMQMPVWFALLSTLIFLMVFYLIISGFDRCQMLWIRLKNWWHLRQEMKLFSKTQAGLAALIEARWKKAEYLLLAGVNQSLEPLINYLGAAKAAHEQKQFDKRDRYIQKAYQVAPNAEVAIGITRAEFELEDNQLEQAVATLNHMRQLSPRHPRLLRLLEKVYIRASDWKALEGLLPQMVRAKLLTAQQTLTFEKNIYCELLRDNTSHTLTAVEETWQQIPRHMKKNPEVVCAYVKQLLKYPNANNNDIEELIRATLKTSWYPELAIIYRTLPFANLNRQLVIASAWLKMYGEQPALLLLLGNLCARAKLWGKAKDYYQKCLALGNNPLAALEYGMLLESLSERSEALQVYRDNLKSD